MDHELTCGERRKNETRVKWREIERKREIINEEIREFNEWVKCTKTFFSTFLEFTNKFVLVMILVNFKKNLKFY